MKYARFKRYESEKPVDFLQSFLSDKSTFMINDAFVEEDLDDESMY